MNDTKTSNCPTMLHLALRIPRVYPSEFLPKGQGGFEIAAYRALDGIRTLFVDTETYEQIKAWGHHVCK